jgi:hypothetical protein
MINIYNRTVPTYITRSMIDSFNTIMETVYTTVTM